MESVWSVIWPVMDIAKDVSSVYGNRLYNYLISNRNPKKHYQFLAKKACSYEQWAAAGYLLDQYESNGQ
ncbi:hypothetical protein BC833DRAFT_367246 [Globomyces pollinis-pini]|nr:hypothetical protein BC833DRAFT_367246 [Globomyces pollinis-pini]